MENACIYYCATCWIGNLMGSEGFTHCFGLPIFRGFDGTIENDTEILFHSRGIGSSKSFYFLVRKLVD